MNISNFRISFSRIESVLKSFNLYQMSGIKSINEVGVSNEFRTASIKHPYFKTYKIGLENYDFDFLTNDQSFFQFEFKVNGDKKEIRYAFFQNPIDFVSYEDYVIDLIEQENLNETVEQIGLLFEDEYHQFLNEQENIANFVTFRYDFDQNNYQPVIHSVSHIHVGHQNNIRIPLNKVISPLKFVLFVIKNTYYNEWKNKIDTDPDYVLKILNEARVHQKTLDEIEWQDEEKLELHIN